MYDFTKPFYVFIALNLFIGAILGLTIEHLVILVSQHWK